MQFQIVYDIVPFQSHSVARIFIVCCNLQFHGIELGIVLAVCIVFWSFLIFGMEWIIGKYWKRNAYKSYALTLFRVFPGGRFFCWVNMLGNCRILSDACFWPFTSFQYCFCVFHEFRVIFLVLTSSDQKTTKTQAFPVPRKISFESTEYFSICPPFHSTLSSLFSLHTKYIRIFYAYQFSYKHLI